MSLLLDWIVQPLTLVFGLLLIALIRVWRLRPFPQAAAWWLLAASGTLWMASAPITANALVGRLETTHQHYSANCELISDRSSVVVPGASIDAYVDSDSPYEILGRDSLTRTLRAAALDSGKQMFYVLGGGQTSRKLSDLMAAVLTEQGIARDRIVLESISRSTIENAQQLAALLEPAQTPPIALVTSSLHANRATATFSGLGFTVCPITVDPLYSVSAGWIGFLPHIDALFKSTQAWREGLAIALYRVRGYIT